MAKQFLSGSIILNEFLRQMSKAVAEIGRSVFADISERSTCARFPRPIRMNLDFPSGPRDFVDEFFSVDVNFETTLPVEFEDHHLTMSVDRFTERYIDVWAYKMTSLVDRSWPWASDMVTARLQLPQGLHWAERAEDPDGGLAVRLLRYFDVAENVFRTGFSMRHGFTQPLLAVPPLVGALEGDPLRRAREALVSQKGLAEKRLALIENWQP